MQAPVRKRFWGTQHALRCWFSSSTLGRTLPLLVAIGSLCIGLYLAWHHPIWPLGVLTIFSIWAISSIWLGNWWLTAVPVGVTCMNFAPWTGWTVFDEFDLLMLGSLASGYLRLAIQKRAPPVRTLSRNALTLLIVLGFLALLSLSRAITNAGGFEFDWYAGYTDTLNSVRVIKSEFYALLCVPLLKSQMDDHPTLAHQRFFIGMVLGLGVVAMAVVWERLAFVDFLDFSRPYRAVALFWEMHVGGEAIDAYLAMAAPFAAWAVVSARRPLAWIGAASLSVLTAYAVLTTFSRGLYIAVIASLAGLAVLLHCRCKRQNEIPDPNASTLAYWRRGATVALLLALFAEVGMVVSVGSYVLERVSNARDDLDSRIMHWQRGLAALQSTTDWLLGVGPGRLPSHYAMSGPMEELSGKAYSASESDNLGHRNSFVALLGPATNTRIGGQFALTQRVPAPMGGLHMVQMDVRAKENADLKIEWCARHLLYDGNCQTAQIQVSAGPTWQPVALHLEGEPTETHWYAPHLALFTLSVLTPGAKLDIDNIQLLALGDSNLLANGEFSEGLAQWLGSAQSYFLPWHIDNLYLEFLVERGLLGLSVFCLLAIASIWRNISADVHATGYEPYYVAAMTGALFVGMTGSVMDVPRVMFLLYWLILGGAILQPTRLNWPIEVRKVKTQK